MSTKTQMTREEAVVAVGEVAVAKVDAANCDFTNRVQCDGDSRVEFSASVKCEDACGEEVTLTAYYYVDQDVLDTVETLDQIDWVIDGYSIC